MENDLNNRDQGTQDSAGAPGGSGSKPRTGSVSRQEVMVLRAKLEDRGFDLDQAECRLAAAVRNGKYMTSKLEELTNKHKYFAPESKRTIENLQAQLDQARNNRTKAYLEQIHQLKFKLEEARIDRINTAHRLSLADRIMASYLAEVEELKEENMRTRSALEKAEKEKASLQRTLQRQKKLDEMEEALKHRLREVESKLQALIDRESRRKRCCLVRWFT